MFYWFVEYKDGKRFEDPQLKHSFSRHIEKHKDNIAKYGIVIVDFMLTTEKNDNIRSHKFYKRYGGQRVKGCIVKKREIAFDFFGSPPTLKINRILLVNKGIDVIRGFELDTGKKKIKFDDLANIFIEE